MVTAEQILENAYQKSVVCVENGFDFPEIELLDVFIQKIETDKSLVQVIVTSLLKKIISPEQDIRRHMAKMDNGYSARVLDTRTTTPFFKKYFPRYANKETAFLTKATRAELIWSLEEGQMFPLRSKNLVQPFLELMDSIERQILDAEDGLIYVFTKLLVLTKESTLILDDMLATARFENVLTIERVIELLETHFQSKLAARLPVIAIFSIYQHLMPRFDRYRNKILRPLNVQTAADTHGFGDIEIWNEDQTPFEIIEIKHQIPIDRNLIIDVIKKSQNTGIQRYYVLTTFKNSFLNTEEAQFIAPLLLKKKQESGIEIIANGIVSSLKYYLRFIEDYHAFVKTYSEMLIQDFRNSTEVKSFHIEDWQRILRNYQISDK
ncbi:MAG: hypothetical protein RL757_2136 [Bacteroidota bacterium]|jgi:DNA (cytosine-5)-methyltransferase 1